MWSRRRSRQVTTSIQPTKADEDKSFMMSGPERQWSMMKHEQTCGDDPAGQGQAFDILCLASYFRQFSMKYPMIHMLKMSC